MTNPIRMTYDQFMLVKTRAESIVDAINQYPISEIENAEKINQLINSIMIDKDAMDIHLESIDAVIDPYLK